MIRITVKYTLNMLHACATLKHYCIFVKGEAMLLKSDGE